MPYTQDNREFQFTTPLEKDKLLFYRMQGSEQLGQPFEFHLDLLSEDAGIALDTLVGQPVSVLLTLPEGGPRYFHGIVTEFGHTGAVGELDLYRAVVRPEFWLLTHTAECRIFQEKTVPEIILDVLKQRGLTDYEDALTATYRKWDYCVQYRESDFQFLSRLMQQEGIYYYFKHEEKKHVLVLADASNSHDTMPNYGTVPYFPPEEQDARERDHIFGWRFSQHFQADKVVLTDFDYERPKADLLSPQKATDTKTDGKYEIFDYPGEYAKNADGDHYSKMRLQEYRRGVAIYRGEGNARGMAPGFHFTLEDFPRDDQNAEYLITSATYKLQGEDYQSLGTAGAMTPFQCEFAAISAATPYRSPRNIAKPVVQGPQTAVVVGKKGDEIWTDKYGRIKVQFHWDRYGKYDEKSSCWIRVAQASAGKTWGAMSIPRIGQEVIVEFLEGDPDRPIVTGQVYNADNMPPYSLPDNQTQSVFKTRSSKKGTKENFNELRFEDKIDKEEVYFHAERDFHRVVENDDTLDVGFEKKDPGDQTINIFNNRTATLKEGDEKLTVSAGNREVTVSKGNDSHTIEKGNRVVTLNMGDDTLTIKMGNQTTKLDVGKSSIEAMQGIELKVGSNSIKIDQSGITLSGITVKIQGQAQLQLDGAITQVKGSAMVEVQGGVVMIN